MSNENNVRRRVNTVMSSNDREEDAVQFVENTIADTRNIDNVNGRCLICQGESDDNCQLRTYCQCVCAYHRECLLDTIRHSQVIQCSVCKSDFSVRFELANDTRKENTYDSDGIMYSVQQFFHMLVPFISIMLVVQHFSPSPLLFIFFATFITIPVIEWFPMWALFLSTRLRTQLYALTSCFLWAALAYQCCADRMVRFIHQRIVHYYYVYALKAEPTQSLVDALETKLSYLDNNIHRVNELIHISSLKDILYLYYLSIALMLLSISIGSMVFTFIRYTAHRRFFSYMKWPLPVFLWNFEDDGQSDEMIDQTCYRMNLYERT